MLVVAVFGAPLFVGLGRGDLRTDEAIYSFAVDRMIESGDWLAPRSSPHEDAVFLEKPPLKFWIVAAPIHLGLLPHDEFGLRFWDAVFGSVAFLYVFAIGRLIAGSMCGLVAVLILFVHPPLVFEHGLRSNNMEALLVLSYCGGIYHYLRWAAAGPDRPRRRHAVMVGLYFVMGFMSKFVAALFLPLVLGSAALLLRRHRALALRDWRLWAWTAALVVALVAPWFVYAFHRFGVQVWETMLAEHIYTRFTRFLNPEHVQPWYHYFTQSYNEFALSRSASLVIGGLIALSIQTIRRRWAEGLVVLLWFALPAAVLSAGTSKIYHYFYPFLPPLALAAGYLAAVAVSLAGPPADRALAAVDGVIVRSIPHSAVFERPLIRAVLMGLTVGALATAVATSLLGPLRIHLGPLGVFRNSGWVRPLLAALVFSIVGRTARGIRPLLVALLVAMVLLPVSAYRRTVSRLDVGAHPTRSARDCVLRVEAQVAGADPPGLYVDLPDRVLWHPLYYYFRKVRPWTRSDGVRLSPLYERLYLPEKWQPALVWEETARELARRPGVAPAPGSPGRPAPPGLEFDGVLLLLPGPYGACALPDDGSRGR